MTILLLTLILFNTCTSYAQQTINTVNTVKTGIEVLKESNYEILQNKRVGLVTNPTGVDSQLNSTIDLLYNNVNLVALYGPEHGIRGNISGGKKVDFQIDEITGLPVYSLYGATRQPTEEMLKDIDIMVYDIQDIGSRSYTYISTLGLVMRTCGAMGIPVVVLDRPNPLGGQKVEGPLVRDGFHSFVGQYKIPYIYGLTVGELATLINEEGLNCGQDGKQAHIKCELHIVKMKGWKRDMLFKDTNIPWVITSGAIPYAEVALNYPSAGIVGELSNYLHIGIGYTLPFGLFGETWVNAQQLKEKLDSYNLPGIAWRTIYFKPTSGRLEDQEVQGVQYYFTDYNAANLTLINFYIMQAIAELYGVNPLTDPSKLVMFNKVLGSDYIQKTFGATMRVDSIIEYWNADAKGFQELSKKYYLY